MILILFIMLKNDGLIIDKFIKKLLKIKNFYKKSIKNFPKYF